MNTRTTQSPKGFTLIEFTIVLAIFAILLTFLYSTIIHTATTVRKIEEHMKRQHKVRTLFEGIIREVRLISADTPPLLLSPNPTSGTTLPTFLKAERNRNGSVITFIAPEGGVYMPGRQSGSTMAQITYRVEPDPDHQGNFLLIRDEMPLLYPAKSAFDNIITFPVHKNIKGFEIRMYNISQKTWTTDWGPSTISPESTPAGAPPPSKIPALIEITLTIETGAGTLRSYTTLVATSGAR
jgi:prepilin-type N-terminal cleavage/methylation domain-containing protein